MRRWLNRPTGSNWGDFGDDDHIGRMNLITPAVRRKGIAAAIEGISFLIGLPLDYPKAQLYASRIPPRLFSKHGENGEVYNFRVPEKYDVISDDGVTMDLQYSTQWDALSHYGSAFDADGDGKDEHIFYNGYRPDRDFILPDSDTAPSAGPLGIDWLARTCVQTRGALVDIRGYGSGELNVVGYEALRRAFDDQAVELSEGDFLCVYTGYADHLLDAGDKIDKNLLDAFPGLDGSDSDLLDWITRSGVSAICADNPTVEKVRDVAVCSDHFRLPLHNHCLFKLGIHLGELWYFRELANWLKANGRCHFLLTAPPLNLPGAVGSPASPVATV